VGKLSGGHQAAVISLAVGNNAGTNVTGSCAVTGSKDRCLKVHAIELFHSEMNVYIFSVICCEIADGMNVLVPLLAWLSLDS